MASQRKSFGIAADSEGLQTPIIEGISNHILVHNRIVIKN